MGEAGGGLPGNSPRHPQLAGTGDTAPPAFAAPICGVFPAHSSFSVFRGTPMAGAIHFKELNCYEIRNKFETSNAPMSQTETQHSTRFEHLNLDLWILFRISCFEFLFFVRPAKKFLAQRKKSFP
jgi:hypothetical protein